jgi:cytidylate kinase
MALIALSGQNGCRVEEVARISAQRLGFHLVTPSGVRALIEQEFGPDRAVPDKAYFDALASIVARLATDHHLILAMDGAELLAKKLPGMLRVYITAPEAVRVGNVMLDRRLVRPAAKEALWEIEAEAAKRRKERFGRAPLTLDSFDLVLNAAALDSEHMVELIESAVRSLGLAERGYLSAAAEAQIQFQIRLRLAKHGIAPAGEAGIARRAFAHHSEQIFANLLDFYRIAWEYEPQSFPIKKDAAGNVTESFTPDFFLPEFNLYVELTTMKQSLVTKKNRKVRLLKELYPEMNIQVFYQKDFENLIFKYGLARSTDAGRLVEA